MRRCDRRGQGLVEFALVSVIMFMVFSGILEMSWWFYNLIYLNNATNKAARMYAKSGGTSLAAQTVLLDEKGGLLISPSSPILYDSTFTVTNTRVRGGYVRIDATMTYGSISPFRSMIYMANLSTIRSQCIMRLE